MKIQYASDLHLEFSQNKKLLQSNPLQPVGDVLVLAGDIVPFAVMHEHDDFFSYVSDHFQTTYWVPGNHEYYYFDIAEKCGTFIEKIKSNVFLVNNASVMLDNVKLIFSTLWTRIGPTNQWYIEKAMTDFHIITNRGERFLASHVNQMHDECLRFIKQELKNKANKNVVVTHHVPTLMNYPELYKTNILNEAFAVELFDFIETDGPDYWIYGHTHTNTPDFEIGKTQLLANQLGYVKYNEHQSFNGRKKVEFVC